MPYRKIIFSAGQIYHVFNRGVASSVIFSSKSGYKRFLDLIDYYRFSDIPFSYSQYQKSTLEERKKIKDSLHEKSNKQVEILSYCLMPNHFHLLLKQLTDNGISEFMKRIGNGYAKYNNIRNKRVGPLFQSVFKAVRIETDEQLLHVSRYIHLNPLTSYIVHIDDLLQYPWSSFRDYMNSSSSTLINSQAVLNFFKNRNSYYKFVLDQEDYQKRLARLKQLMIE